MKIDDVTLQNILKTYGKDLKPDKSKAVAEKKETTANDEKKPAIDGNELEIINYDKDGKPIITQKNREALIDFFQ